MPGSFLEQFRCPQLCQSRDVTMPHPRIIHRCSATWRPYGGFNSNQHAAPHRQRSSAASLARLSPPCCSSQTLLSPECSYSSGIPKQAEQSSNSSKSLDLVTISNLCVDVFVKLDELPPKDVAVRRQLLAQLEASTPDVSDLEVGANCNVMITAARLGLKVASVGNLGSDRYGNFLADVLQEEGVLKIEPLLMDPAAKERFRTLVCYVLVTPNAAHSFCSRYDFGPWPLLPGITSIPPNVAKVLRDTKAVFLNGFIFDDLPEHVVVSAVDTAARAGAAIFFDPGPRSWTLRSGARRAALDAVLDASDVVLMTQEEAEAVTGEREPEAAGRSILARPGCRTQWCIVKMGAAGALLCSRSLEEPFRQQALQVNVKDTVGCGDSFAAAVVLGYTQGHDVAPLLALANAVGAATAMGAGAGRNVASADNVLRLLETVEDGYYGGAEKEAIRALKESMQQGAPSAASAA